MRLLSVVMALVLGTTAWAATIQISPSPIPLRGQFRVIVAGLEAQAGQAVVVNVKTGQLVKVPLEEKDGRLISAPIYALRGCEPVPQGAEYVLPVRLGDVVAAATDLDKGLSTTALVVSAGGEARLVVAAWGQKDWHELASGSQLPPGKLRVTVSDPSADETCDRETVPVTIGLGEKTTHLDLLESGPASGEFTAELSLAAAISGQELSIKLLRQGKELLCVPLGPDTALTVAYGELKASYPIAQLDVRLKVDPADKEDAGCPIEIGIAGQADEVHWFVDGKEQPDTGPTTLVVQAAPTYPEPMTVVAIVRAGKLWGKGETEVTFVPHTEIAFLDADTGEPVTDPVRCGARLKIKLTGVLDDPHPHAWIGLLGAGCSAVELQLSNQGGGVFLSQEFATDSLAACAGDVLWAEYKDPTCPGDVAYTLLVLK